MLQNLTFCTRHIIYLYVWLRDQLILCGTASTCSLCKCTLFQYLNMSMFSRMKNPIHVYSVHFSCSVCLFSETFPNNTVLSLLVLNLYFIPLNVIFFSLVVCNFFLYLVHTICSLSHTHTHLFMMQTVTAGMATSTREDIIRISRYVNLGGYRILCDHVHVQCRRIMCPVCKGLLCVIHLCTLSTHPHTHPNPKDVTCRTPMLSSCVYKVG